jgi:hypothetical protein
MAASRLATHDSRPGWLATPFLYDSFIHNSKPVYPGALIILLVKRVRDAAEACAHGEWSKNQNDLRSE